MPRGGPSPRPERYWTDYLRIALPIIGLILMLSVFIFWVGSIIDGNNDDADVTPSAVALVQTPAPSDGAVTATVAPTQSAAPSNAEGANTSPSGEAIAAGDTEPTTEPSAEESTAPDDEPTDEPAADEAATEPPADEATFAADDVVTVNEDGEDGVNIREAAGTDAVSVATVVPGDVLTIVSGPETAGDLEWYEVTTEDGTEGWIASQFLDASEG